MQNVNGTSELHIPESEKDTAYKTRIWSNGVLRIGTKYKGVDEIYLGYKDTHKGRVAIGHKTIQYHNMNKTVTGIVIRGTAEDDDWDSDFDMGDLDILEAIQDETEQGHENHGTSIEKVREIISEGLVDKYDTQYAEELLHFAGGYPDWTHKYHHAGFDIVANRILEVVREYMEQETREMNDDYCFWVTGHSMGGGVANIVGAELLHSWSGINDKTNNVYCYTFAAPSTFYLTDNHFGRDNLAIQDRRIEGNYREPHGSKYRCIFNIVNDDDFVPKLPMEECEWTKYGRVAGKSFNSDFWPNQSKLNISFKFDQYHNPGRYTPQVQGNKCLYYFATEYRGDSENPKVISKAFAELFNDKSNMRKESYTFDEKFNITISIEGLYDIINLDSKLFRWTLPFQKNSFLERKYVPVDRVEWLHSQKMCPQYLFQSVGEMMHNYSDYEDDVDSDGKRRKIGGFDNIFKFFSLSLPSKLYEARKSFLSFIPLNLRALYLEHPHYLESYYSLTKIINTTDFK